MSSSELSPLLPMRTHLVRVAALLAVLLLPGLSSAQAPGEIVYTGDIIRMRVAANGTPAIDVAATCSGCPSWVFQYYGQTSWGSVVWIGGGTPSRYSTGYFTGPAFTPVSNTLVPINDGNGAEIGASIVTVLDLGSTGLRLTQTFTYYRGNRYLTKRWHIDNTSGSATPELRLFHGGDSYFGGDDSARSFYDPAKSMVYVRNQDYTNWGLMGFYANPATPASHYSVGNYYTDVYQFIDAEPPRLPDLANVQYEDAGYGLEWNNAGIPAGGSWTVEAYEVWTEGGAGQVLAPAAQNVAPATTVTLPFSVQNLSTTSTTFTLTASTSAGWTATIPEGTTVTLAQNGSATVNVQVNVPAGAANGASSNVSLVASALGLTASAATTLTVVNLPVDISLPEIDFTAIVGGQQVVAIENTGNASFTFGTIATQAPFGTTDDTCSSATLAIGATCTVKVTFSSGTPGTYSTNLNIPVVSPVLLTRTIPLTASVGGPTASGDTYSTTVNTTLTVDAAAGVLANDTDPDPITAVLAAAPQHGTLTLNSNGSFSYVPDTNYVGTDAFTYRANNGTASSTAQTVTITISAGAPPNTAPVGVADAYTTSKNTAKVVAAGAGVLANDTDADNDLLTATLVTGPAHGTLALNADGSFTYTPATDYVGGDSFTYTASDGTVASAATTVTLTVTAPPNTAPVGVADSYITTKNTPKIVTAGAGVLANDTDADSDPLTATLVSGPAHGTLTLNADGSFTYTPTPNYVGGDSFTYTAGDGTASSATTTVTLTVNPPANTAPVGVADAYVTTKNTAKVVPAGSGVLANDTDADSDPLTATLVTGPAHGTLALNADGSFTYTPATGYVGSDSFTYTAGDGTAASAPTPVSLTVAAPPLGLTHVYPATGPAQGGTNIRVYGQGFLRPPPSLSALQAAPLLAAQVLINGVPAPAVVIESDTVISAITPALPVGTPLDIVVAVPTGTVTLPSAYTPYESRVEPAGDDPLLDPRNPLSPDAPTTDTDGDGLTDVWEEFYGTDPHDPSDASADLDGDGKTNLQEFEAKTHPNSRAVRYFAEGNAAAPFRTWVNVYNPSPIEAVVNLTFYLDDATVLHHLVKAAGGERTTIDTGVLSALQGHAFGLQVDADEAIVINRTITWNDQGVGATAERGVTLSPTWYFAEGATHSSLQTFLLLANPADTAATVEVEYLMANGQPRTRTHVVPAHARLTVWVNQEGPEWTAAEFGMAVRASHPLVAERATYLSSGATYEAGETSVGAQAPADRWLFAEGVAGPEFDTFLLLANPGDQTAEVQVRYLTESGAPVVRTHLVPARNRTTVRVNDEAAWTPRQAFGIDVRSTNGVGIVAERAMWWSTDQDAVWEEGHGSSGVTTPGTAFAIGDGIAGGAQGASTYVLIATPGAADAQVTLTVAFEDGTAPATAQVLVPAGRRVTVDVASLLPIATGKRFSARVESVNGEAVVVEQSIYWTYGSGSWKAGVSLPATRLDVTP